jgi:hypothetical protein
MLRFVNVTPLTCYSIPKSLNRCPAFDIDFELNRVQNPWRILFRAPVLETFLRDIEFKWTQRILYIILDTCNTILGFRIESSFGFIACIACGVVVKEATEDKRGTRPSQLLQSLPRVDLGYVRTG